MHFDIKKQPFGPDDVADLVGRLVDQEQREANDECEHRDHHPAMHALQDVIDDGGPSMVYQPIVHLDSNKVIGAEALSRFPSGYTTWEWFEIAGQVGLAADIEMLAAYNAIDQLGERTRIELGWEFVGINISAQTLVHPRFIELVGGNIGRHIVLELTDQREQPDWPVLRSHLDRARDLGVRIALNALTGDTIEHFPRLIDIAPDIIKLDTGYTKSLVAHPEQRAIAEDFVVSCAQRGAFVVAVGVEEADDLDPLVDIGVEAAQGWFFGKPKPLDEFEIPAPGAHVADLPLGRW